MIEKVFRTVQIIDRQMDYWLPRKAFCAYSGGRDSAVLLDILARLGHKRYVGAMSIETGLSADGWREMVLGHCASVGTRVEFVEGLGWNWYEENVLNYGFGYTRGHHTVYYRMLKQSAIQKHLKSAKVGYRDRIVYFTGVRRGESWKRASAKEFYRHGSRISVNPLIHWTDRDVEKYLRVVANWWDNPYYETVGNSGDCLCGWTCGNTVAAVSREYPIIGGRLRSLSQRAVDAGMWSYGTRPISCDHPVASDDIPASGDMPNDSLCSSCSRATRVKG